MLDFKISFNIDIHIMGKSMHRGKANVKYQNVGGQIAPFNVLFNEINK